MKPKAYVETSVVSYLTAWPSRDVVIAGHQQSTRDWWDICPANFELVASEIVVQEAAAGDAEAARERLEALDSVLLLEITEDALALARQLVGEGAIPSKATEDALHIALAAVHGIDYLVTWNCKHIANATMRSKIEDVCRSAGYEPPIICTPEELLEATEDVE
jgi:predicted nucleic acid-binding protein